MQLKDAGTEINIIFSTKSLRLVVRVRDVELLRKWGGEAPWLRAKVGGLGVEAPWVRFRVRGSSNDIPLLPLIITSYNQGDQT